MYKNVLIGALILVSILALALAYRNAKPVCQDLTRWTDGNLYCIYSLGAIQEDEANVIMTRK